ncbi:TetR/AcrR family transcriptional regulator [Microbacterium sp. NIBRBAC000506063]|uniref:TetR/AcrR family transcriptional regulator n=1 Tax=Microbacterium sp. NIBRBAC000506063 TaxID=2734618 RepID=UPI001CB72B4C|nr:TetR/AcrR family transcriptional regulator [Microbacterium sp. NIBRBAC000506063]
MAKREEILTVALDVIARHGYRRTSVRELADAVGLSQAGVLHYFESKEELFTAILRKRDEVDLTAYGHDDATDDLVEPFLRIIRHNAEVPGLVQLYTRLAAEATDPQHAAHEFFRERGQGLRDVFVARLQQRRDAGHLHEAVDPDTFATVLIALADGLQTQWLNDPTIDMAAHIEHVLALASPAAGYSISSGSSSTSSSSSGSLK